MQALLAPCPVEQFSHMQHSGDSITFSSCLLMVIQGKALAKDSLPLPARCECSSFPHGPQSQGRGWCCLGLLTESDLSLCWQGTHPRRNPVVVSWDRDRDCTAKSGQQVKRRKACVVNVAEKR